MKKTDSEIEQLVLRELSSEDLGSAEICVQSHQGIVTLGGSVPNITHKLAAAHAVDRVPEIAGVVNDLKIEAWKISASTAADKPAKQFAPAPLVARKRMAHRSARGATPSAGVAQLFNGVNRRQ